MDADSQLKRVPAVKPIKRLEEALCLYVFTFSSFLGMTSFLPCGLQTFFRDVGRSQALEKLVPQKPPCDDIFSAEKPTTSGHHSPHCVPEKGPRRRRPLVIEQTTGCCELYVFFFQVMDKMEQLRKSAEDLSIWWMNKCHILRFDSETVGKRKDMKTMVVTRVKEPEFQKLTISTSSGVLVLDLGI